MDKILITLGALVLVVCAAAAIGVLLAFPIKWTWNATMPEIFDLIKITWGQAWCLSFLSSCLIKSSLTNKSND